MFRISLIAILLSALSIICNANDFIMPDDEIKEMAEQATKIKIDPLMIERTQSIINVINSDDYKKKMAKAQAAAKETLSLDTNPYVKESDRKTKVIAGDFLYIFISSSMPIETVRAYVYDAAKIKSAVLVMRGFIGGAKNVKPTVKYVADILKKDPSCNGNKCPMHSVEVQIDPILYADYRISGVPAVVFKEGVNFTGYCSRDDNTEQAIARKAVVAYGDTSLEFALGEIYKKTNNRKLLSLKTKLEPQPWEYQK